jgi:peptidase M28-like protein/PA domain-containing protein
VKPSIPITVLLCGSALLFGSAQAARPLDLEYREAAGRLIGAAMVDRGGYDRLAYLTTRIGNRLSGSSGLERGIAWVAEQMKADGFGNVHLQAVKVPHWVRGSESARIMKPIQKPLNMLGLGRSVATPREGITATVVVVNDFDELERLGAEKVKGNIVLYDAPWQGYARTVAYRSTGASRAARLGAVATLVRSVTPRSIYSPHTGALNYDPAAPKIPSAAITAEDAAWIHQMTAMGQDVQVHLQMDAETLPDADSANVIGEIAGRERPEEVVVIGGHIDSWDVGQGAHDDGAGIIAAWRAVALMKELGLTPRRTVRVVAWTNEENGTRGANAYRDGLGAGVGTHVAAIEMDGGAERPTGFGYGINGLASSDPRALRAAATLREIARLLEGIGANAIETGGGETDIEPLMRAGVPGLGLLTVNEHYFDWHHTNADTFDKIDLQDFRKCIASLAVMAYVLADMPGRL